MKRSAQLTVIVEFPEDPEACPTYDCLFYVLNDRCSLPEVRDRNAMREALPDGWRRTDRCKEVFGQ